MSGKEKARSPFFRRGLYEFCDDGSLSVICPTCQMQRGAFLSSQNRSASLLEGRLDIAREEIIAIVRSC
jgi:hypothetical protein